MLKIRVSIAVALLLTLFVIIRGVGGSFKNETLPDANTREAKLGTSVSESEKLAYYPEVPEVMPDLLDGYIFNAERKLELESTEEEEVPEEEVDIGAAASDFEQVEYSGSIIMDNQRLALIKFPEKEEPAPEEKQKPLSRLRRPGKMPEKPGKKASSGGLKNFRVRQGENFNGFIVAEIEPEKIVFERGGEKIVKYLYDKEKDRPEVVSKPESAEIKPVQEAKPVEAEGGVKPEGVPLRRSMMPPSDMPVGLPSAPGEKSSKPQFIKPEGNVAQKPPGRRTNQPSRGRRGLYRMLDQNLGAAPPPAE